MNTLTKIFITASVATLLLFVGLFSYNTLTEKQLPKCDDNKQTYKTLEKIILQNSTLRAANVVMIEVKEPIELGYNSEKEIRMCNATLITSAGEDKIAYVITWEDKAKGEYHIKLRLDN